MSSTGLRGPFGLTPRGINEALTEALPGVYALGKVANGGFEVHYIGMAPEDVKSHLWRHVADWYPQFYYRHYSTSQAAFEKQCELFHDLKPRDNRCHPERPEHTRWMCPRCGMLFATARSS